MLKALPAISRNKRVGRSLLRPYRCPPSLWRALYYIGFEIALRFDLTGLVFSIRRKLSRNPNSEASDLKPEAPYSTSNSAVPRGGAIAPPVKPQVCLRQNGGGTARRNSACCAGEKFGARALRFKVGRFKTIDGCLSALYFDVSEPN